MENLNFGRTESKTKRKKGTAAADMVLVTVGKNYTPDFVLIFHKVGYVRDNQVETGTLK